MAMQETIRAYYTLTKPGVTYGNVLTVVAGYLLAAAGTIHWLTFVALVVGMTLIIASACTLNNYLDQDIDARMERTKSRPSITAGLSAQGMIGFAISLFAFGFLLLAVFTNELTLLTAVLGYVTYVWLYGALSKRRSVHGTIVGSISGAFPIVAGYVAARGHLDAGALITFLILFFWQFPEFYSIAIYRRTEYNAAGIPLISIVKGVPTTIRHIFIYTVLYVAATIALTVAGYTGYVYLVVMAGMGVRWILMAARGLRTPASKQDAWARQMFTFSMMTILVLCLMLSIGPILP